MVERVYHQYLFDECVAELAYLLEATQADTDHPRAREKQLQQARRLDKVVEMPRCKELVDLFPSEGDAFGSDSIVP